MSTIQLQSTTTSSKPLVAYQKHEKQVAKKLSSSGMGVLGWFNHENHPAMLIGNIGGAMWHAYKTEKITLDEWTQNTIAPIAKNINAKAIYPFQKPAQPFQKWARGGSEAITAESGNGETTSHQKRINRPYPFQQWAIAAMGVHQSPLKILIHEKYGLWFALRAALIFNQTFKIPTPKKQISPCESCETKPCLTSCPVNAVTMQGYDINSCQQHAKTHCIKIGCAARQACPINKYQYSKPQQIFHATSGLSPVVVDCSRQDEILS